MPVDTINFWLKPVGFFDHNPALDVAPRRRVTAARVHVDGDGRPAPDGPLRAAVRPRHHLASANRVVLEVLSGMARRRRDAAEGSTWDPRQPLLDGR